jgi:hypothetical protein
MLSACSYSPGFGENEVIRGKFAFRKIRSYVDSVRPIKENEVIRGKFAFRLKRGRVLAEGWSTLAAPPPDVRKGSAFSIDFF